MDSRIDDLVRAAADGVDCDGLRVARRDGFAFATPETDRTGLTESELRTLARDHRRYVSNWYHWERTVGERAPSRRAFLRWVERADRPVPDRYDALETGVTRTWGQLSVAVSLGPDGRREYELRHVDDRDADAASLEPHADPSETRDAVRFTDDGAYRPLKAAPTLPSGWVLPDLDADALLRAVEHVYPATVENWHREREGDLDVTHFEGAAARQTGTYADVGDLDRDALERAAEACCTDSACLKRRAWDASGDDELDAPRGDGEFPCREPCSLFVAAAREFLADERGSERTTELSLTEGEYEQLRALVDAAAEGRLARDGDVSDPANRYRARYLREKRFAEAR